jgi:glutathione synthetase
MTSTAQADRDFTGKLLEIYKNTYEQNKNQFALAVHRSDYMLHHDAETKQHTPQQVELNTISSAFLSLTTLTHNLHKYLRARLGVGINPGELIKSQSIESVPELFAKAHRVFGEKGNVILFIGQPNERNIADQKHFEHRLWENHGIPVIRKTLTQLGTIADILVDSNRDLVVEGQIVSVVYYRAGYTPNDYPTDAEWKARSEIERSTAIKCPNIGYHLVGAKKIQQVMYNRQILGQFVDNDEQVDDLMSIFTGLYGLEKGVNDHIIQEAMEKHGDYVLKPQREGGGNLIHSDEMKKVLAEKLDQEGNREKYILMKRICPQPFHTAILRSGEIKRGECVSELGTFGLYLGNGQEQVVNECGGYLLRTKMAHDEDGGVASGIASMDSLALY